MTGNQFTRNEKFLAIMLFFTLFYFSFGEYFAWETAADQPQKLVKQKVVPLIDPETGLKTYEFNIEDLSATDDYYSISEPIPLIPTNTKIDEHKVVVFTRDGKTYNHPVRLAQHAILYVSSYKITNDRRYLEMAELQAQRLADIAVKQGDAMYFPYDFEVYLHNIPSERFAPKWYSGMSQGQALSAFARLYEVTKDEKYLKWAEQTYNSLTYVKTGKKDEIWVSMVDDKYLWFEEYPLEEPTKVLNGFIYAIFGVYDYYQIAPKEDVKKTLQASLTTLYDHVDQYRVVNDVSRYGLKHDHQSKFYHGIHMKQLETVYKMTGDEYFKEVKTVFYHDWHQGIEKKRGLEAKIKYLVEKVRSKL